MLSAKPDIFNTDQGSQFTGAAFTGALAEKGITISMDGKGAWRDNETLEVARCSPRGARQHTWTDERIFELFPGGRDSQGLWDWSPFYRAMLVCLHLLPAQLLQPKVGGVGLQPCRIGWGPLFIQERRAKELPNTKQREGPMDLNALTILDELHRLRSGEPAGTLPRLQELSKQSMGKWRVGIPQQELPWP